MKKGIFVSLVLALVVIFSMGNTVLACEPGNSPGFWKNHTEEWNTVGTEGQDLTGTYLAIFGVGPDISLLEVLELKGNKDAESAFLRQSVASLLNTTYIENYWHTWDVIALVQAVYPDGGTYGGVTEYKTLDWWKDYLESYNSR
ncbi:MAG: hypothetical protein JW915_04095 [Chitinispirillaceae bacterium]|nr:hypothetical protein [Chitinispirillaceae bacterium]